MSGIKDIPVMFTAALRDRILNTLRAVSESTRQCVQRQELRKATQELSDRCMQRLNERLQQHINGLNAEMRAMAEAQNRRLTSMANDYNRSIKELQEQREKDRAELEKSIRDVANRIAAKECTHQKQAEFWISQTEVFFADVEQYRHELFTPGQLNRLRELLRQVSQDMRSEAYQSAITSARNVFNQVADLKERVVNAEIEWANYHSQFQQNFSDLRSNLYYYQTMQFTINTDAGEETVDAKIDYWTNGALTDIAQEISRIESATEDIYQVSTAQLIEFLNDIEELNQKLDDACQRAKNGLICSQTRAEIAGNLADQLQQAGWEFVDCTYEGNEQNAPLHVKLRDTCCNEIVAIISPQQLQDTLTANIELNFFDPSNNDANMRGIWADSIVESLRRNGLDVGKPITRPGYEVKQSNNEAIRDLQATASKKSQR